MVIRHQSDIPGLRERLAEQRRLGRRIGFVPTMGYLHDGHQSLIRQSAADGCYTVVSIFVNPAQFGPNEDLATYPRDHDGDFARCETAGADLVWYPEVADLYPSDAETMVTPGPLAQRLCGLSRPQFFGGICTVVLKFFQLIKPDVAYFGEKDYQQLAIIRQMAVDFYLDVNVIGGPTVREADGLAMSSRNARLKPGDRDLGLTLYRTITTAREAYASGERNAAKLRERLVLTWPNHLDLDYLDFRDDRKLELVDQLDEHTRIFLGAWLDGVRLIDNAALSLSS